MAERLDTVEIDRNLPIQLRSCSGNPTHERGHVLVAWQGRNKIGEYQNVGEARQQLVGFNLIENLGGDTLCDICGKDD